MQSSAGKSGVGYSRADRILHHLALGFAPVLEMSFDLERGRFGKAAAGLAVDRPVFVCGLARAGTSVLMRLLHATGAFASLSYRDLPFPLAPNSWARLGKGRSVEAHERGHGDGLLHDLDTPEAIEEVFWRAQEGSRYLKAEGLAPVAPAPETVEAFAAYVRLVLLRYGRARYLSKNNNNILRLSALAQAFPDAALVHPFRDPLQQAESLRNQHLRACALQAEDGFRRSFMGWLGHHEFGAGQRPFLLPDAPEGNRGHIDYWLASWIHAYRWLLSQPGPVQARQHFLDYDRLCAGGHAVVTVAGMEVPLTGLRAPEPRPAEGARAALVREARELHAELSRRASAPAGSATG